MIKKRHLLIALFLCTNVGASQGHEQCARLLLLIKNNRSQGLLFGPDRFKSAEFLNAEQHKSWIQKKINQKKASLGLKYDAALEFNRILGKLDFSKVTSERQLKRIAEDLAVALYGRQNTLDQYLFQSSEQRSQQNILYKVRLQVIYDSLFEVWSFSQSTINSGLIRRTRTKISRQFSAFADSKVGHFLLHMPLPKWRDLPLSDELKQAIERDGYDAHKSEIEKLYKWSDQQNFYNTFKNKILTSVLVTMIAYNAPEQIALLQEQLEDQKQLAKAEEQAIVEQWSSFEGELLESVLNSKEQILLNAYLEAYAEFETHWGEPPSDVEQKLIQEKIQRELGL
jgi:hypothetical protein